MHAVSPILRLSFLGCQLQMQSKILMILPLVFVGTYSSFYSPQTFVHHRKLTSSSRSRGYRNNNRCAYPTVRQSSSQFDIGDEVIVVDDDGATFISGRIELKRGGWYTIKSTRDSKRLKRRGTQLQTKNEPNPLQVLVDNEESLLKVSTNIIDLDLLLQYPHDIRYQNRTSYEISNDTLDQIASCHSQYNQWVVFSDLHVMPTTLAACLDVLDTVHKNANRTNSGIIFLGDFWHHRGFVRVDCLNAVLHAMSKWTVPCIMIPGNHDQTDWSGLEHALTPLSNAYHIYSSKFPTKQQQQHAGPLILSQPTKFMNALFIPHVRDRAIMEYILSSTEALSASALFVHADVKGASMNDLIQSQHGLNASIFPRNKQIYSGHFHKPQFIQAGSDSTTSKSFIRYVGSPYQTSFAESGQVKSLIIVDATKQWEVIEEIPIDIGPKYHRITTLEQFLRCNWDHIRKGDKVSVMVDQDQLEEMRSLARANVTNPGEKTLFDVRLERFQESGIAVEIRDSLPKDEINRIAPLENKNIMLEIEELSPGATLAAYLAGEVENGMFGEDTSTMLQETLDELIREAKNDAAAFNSVHSEALVSQLHLETLTAKGFGSFRQRVVYPLSNRGLVLLRGTNRDDIGSDSNGVGKSTLAMAALWVLTGTVDPRPTQDGKVSDVINDSCRVSEASLCGSINNKPFIVTRTKSASSQGSSLTFVLDGQTMTQQSILATQQLIDQYLNVGSQILTRTIFHGQHTIGGLLESSDAKLKEELSQLVALDIWQQTSSLARSKQRELLRKSAEIDGMVGLRAKDKTRAEEKARIAKEEVRRREGILEDEKLAMRNLNSLFETHDTDIVNAIELVQTQLHDCNNEIIFLQDEILKETRTENDELSAIRNQANDMVADENVAKSYHQECQRQYDIANMDLQSARNNLRKLKLEWNIGMDTESNSPGICHTCGQSIVSSNVREHLHERMEGLLAPALSMEAKANDFVRDAERELTKAKEVAETRTLEVQVCMKQLQMAKERQTFRTEELHEKIKAKRLIVSQLSIELATLTKRAKDISEMNLRRSRMEANLEKMNEALYSSIAVYEDCCSDLERLDSSISSLKQEKDDFTTKASHFGLMAEKLGPKGVQAFVLRNIVQALQQCSQSYLNELSDGSLQFRMEVGSNDSIHKQAAMRNTDGTWRVRPLSSLSGGQWRRLSLSLGLGFIDLASKRGRLRSSLLVLDEPLTHLDSTGRKNVGKLLRKMLSHDSQLGKTGRGGFSLSTILVILQEIVADEIEECFDQIDEVVKHGGESFVFLDSNTNLNK